MMAWQAAAVAVAAWPRHMTPLCALARSLCVSYEPVRLLMSYTACRRGQLVDAGGGTIYYNGGNPGLTYAFSACVLIL